LSPSCIALYAKSVLEFRDGKVRRDYPVPERLIASEVLPTRPSLDEIEDEEQPSATGD
jgi:hypothetical protein